MRPQLIIENLLLSALHTPLSSFSTSSSKNPPLSHPTPEFNGDDEPGRSGSEFNGEDEPGGSGSGNSGNIRRRENESNYSKDTAEDILKGVHGDKQGYRFGDSSGTVVNGESVVDGACDNANLIADDCFQNIIEDSTLDLLDVSNNFGSRQLCSSFSSEFDEKEAPSFYKNFETFGEEILFSNERGNMPSEALSPVQEASTDDTSSSEHSCSGGFFLENSFHTALSTQLHSTDCSSNPSQETAGGYFGDSEVDSLSQSLPPEMMEQSVDSIFNSLPRELQTSIYSTAFEDIETTNNFSSTDQESLCNLSSGSNPATTKYAVASVGQARKIVNNYYTISAVTSSDDSSLSGKSDSSLRKLNKTKSLLTNNTISVDSIPKCGKNACSAFNLKCLGLHSDINGNTSVVGVVPSCGMTFSESNSTLCDEQYSSSLPSSLSTLSCDKLNMSNDLNQSIDSSHSCFSFSDLLVENRGGEGAFADPQSKPHQCLPPTKVIDIKGNTVKAGSAENSVCSSVLSDHLKRKLMRTDAVDEEDSEIGDGGSIGTFGSVYTFYKNASVEGSATSVQWSSEEEPSKKNCIIENEKCLFSNTQEFLHDIFIIFYIIFSYFGGLQSHW